MHKAINVHIYIHMHYITCISAEIGFIYMPNILKFIFVSSSKYDINKRSLLIEKHYLKYPLTSV